MTQMSGSFVRVLLDAVELQGVSRDVLLSESHCKLEDLEGSESRIEIEVFRRMILRALKLSSDSALGLHLGERASEAAFDLLGHLISHAPTMRDAIALCGQFQTVFMEGTRTTLEERAGTARWACEFIRTDVCFDTVWTEFVVVGMLRALRTFAGGNTRPEGVCFVHRRPPHHHEYTRIFGGAERFGQLFNGIEFSSHLLDRPHLYRHSELHALLLAQAERVLGRIGRSVGYSERLQHYFLARSPARIPDMSAAARELGVSERTLRRKLAEEGVSYRELVQSALVRVACTMLRDPRSSVQAVAHALGFSEVTAFHRAFKRWVGVTPLEYRRDPSTGNASSAVIDRRSTTPCSRES
jgi:AraC-like DNA-binding protein